MRGGGDVPHVPLYRAPHCARADRAGVFIVIVLEGPAHCELACFGALLSASSLVSSCASEAEVPCAIMMSRVVLFFANGLVWSCELRSIGVRTGLLD